MRNERNFSLGHSVLDSNLEGGRPVVTLNFVNPDHRLTLPYPDGDWYLRNMAVPAITSGETVICTKLIPGLMDHYGKIGLIPEDAEVIQVEPNIGEDLSYGFPATDPLEAISGHCSFVNGKEPLVLVPTYDNAGTARQAESLGLGVLKRTDSIVTNNKAEFRRMADKYQIPLLPGRVVAEGADIEQVIDEFGNTENGVWLKFATGSGGDLVYHVEDVSRETLLGGISAIRSAVLRAFEQGSFSVRGSDFWPEGKIAPENLPLVAETDARNMGEVLVNGSNHFITSDKGVNILGHFQQILTENGEYLGSRSFQPQPDVKKILNNATRKAGNYNISENSFYGMQGVDWFLVRDSLGNKKIYVVELNSRPIVSTISAIIAEKLKTRHWINTNAYTDVPINTIDDFVSAVGEDLAFGSPETGLIVPQAFRTLVTRRRNYPSPDFKIAIFGSSEDHCDAIVNTLRLRNIRFTPTP